MAKRIGDKPINSEVVTIEKLVNGGQGLARLNDGRVVFVWNALPKETVGIRIIKRKKNYLEAVADHIIEPSPMRRTAKDTNFLDSSPWQIMTREAEAVAKITIVQELISGTDLPEIKLRFHHSPKQWHYRNKMDYGFFGDDQGLHLALRRRGSHQKQIIEGSSLAMPAIDSGAHALISELSAAGLRASVLKGAVIRANQANDVAISLFIKENVPGYKFILPKGVRGLNVYYSDPKSPANQATKRLLVLGNTVLHDNLFGFDFSYDPDTFFQVNLGAFKAVLNRMKREIIGQSLVDMYAGVGTIGISLAKSRLDLVEINSRAAILAKQNASGLKQARIHLASSEDSLELIPSDRPVIFDPPRTGLHPKVIAAIRERRPPQIIYLSCNPATLVRDMSLMSDLYLTKVIDLYNFFPKTPHIEALAILRAL